jgi:hypothetical protein
MFNIVNIQDGQVWFQIKESQALLAKGIPGELGLYAAREFQWQFPMGRYVGEILSPQEGRARSELPGRAGQYVVNVTLYKHKYAIDGSQPLQSDAEQQQLFGRVLIPHAQFVPQMHAEFANDPRGTGFHSNAWASEDGWLHSTRHINTGEEILWSYGSGYWAGR